MKTILFASGKGGVGKSTLCRTAAVVAAQEGGRVLLVDLDPQQSLSKWWGNRTVEDIEMLDVSPKMALLREAVSGAVRSYDWLLIDTPPSAPAWLADVMRVADLVVVPTRPSPDDLQALGPTLKALKEAGTPFLFALTQVPVRGRLIEESARALARHGRVCPTNIGLRVAYQEGVTSGQGVSEMGDEKARGEARALWQFIREVVE